MTTKKQAGSKKRLTVKIVDGVLVISIGMATLGTAIRYIDDLMAFDELTGKYLDTTISDDKLFGKELVRALEDEDEEGSTPVHLMLDAAVMSAIENGAEGIITGDDKLDNLRRERSRNQEAAPLALAA